MNHGFLDSGRRNNNHTKKTNTDTGDYGERKAKFCGDTTVLGSNPPLPTQETTSAGNAPGKSAYANVTGKPSGTKLNFQTLFTPGGSFPGWVDESYKLVQSMFSLSTRLFSFQFSSIEGLNAMLENGPWFIRNNSLILKKWHPDDGLSAIATKLGDVELRDNIVAVMPKITEEGYYTCNIRVEYEWKLPRCACCKVFGHTHEVCPKNIVTGEMKNLKKTSQTPNGFSVGQKIGFKPTKQVYQPVSKKPTANTSVNKKKNVNPTKEIRKVTLVDDEGKPMEKVASLCDYDSEDEVASVNNDMAKFVAKIDGYGTQSLLEQCTKSYKNDDYGYDPYDDDMYEGQDIPEKLQAICDKIGYYI
nr:hypothetical protein [Tanacetum cinerariifolium]